MLEKIKITKEEFDSMYEIEDLVPEPIREIPDLEQKETFEDYSEKYDMEDIPSDIQYTKGNIADYYIREDES